jgi:alpha-D-xyloside xylohydrolase
MVCPVVQPMYYDIDSQPISDSIKSRSVYLPAGCSWFNFWDNTLHEGGQSVTADAPLDTIPLYARAGSILPMTQVMQYVDEIPDAAYEIRVYRGADSSFTIYEDAGDGYGYENGDFALVQLEWKEQSGELRICARQGNYPELVERREYRVVLVSSSESQVLTVQYSGEEILIGQEHNGRLKIRDAKESE